MRDNHNHFTSSKLSRLKTGWTLLLFLCPLVLFSFETNHTFGQSDKVLIGLDSTTDSYFMLEAIKERAGDRFAFRDIISTNSLRINPEEELSDLEKGVEVEVQTIISGTVTDIAGQPLIGVTVVEKNSSTGTQTDFDGNFTLSVSSENVTLVTSYIGFETQEIETNGQDNLQIVLLEDVSQLDEVVIVGYGIELKRTLTSSITTVDTEQLEDTPVTHLSNALAGRAPGVRVNIVGGRPGTASSINIRSATTGGFFGNASPLYVIDGIIADKNLFDLLDPNEIGNFSILKDAAATAIYGARASNGVILINTKTGKKGKPQININSSIGTSDLITKADYLTAYELALLTNDAVVASEEPEIAPPLGRTELIPDNQLAYLRDNPFPSFADTMLKTGIVSRYAANVSGATDAVNYFLGASYVDEEGILPNLNYDKTNLRAKVGVNLFEGFRASLNVDAVKDEDFQFFWPFDPEDLFDSYRQAERRGNWGPMYIDGLPVANFNAFHVESIASNLALGDRTRITDVSNYTLAFDYDAPFLEGLSAGVSYNKRKVVNFTTVFRKPSITYNFAPDPSNPLLLTNEITGVRTRQFGGVVGNSISKSTANTDSYQLNLKLGYNRSFGDHTIRANLIYEQFELEIDNFIARRNSLLSFDIPQLFATSPEAEDRFANGAQTETGRLSYVGSLIYTFKDRYILNGNFRVDGSTQFAVGNRYGFFPSISGAWVISEESFFADGFEIIDFLKIRASFGRTGNDNIQGSIAFPYLTGFQASGSAIFGNGNGAAVTIANRGIPNVNLSWDKTETLNIGVDLELFNNRLATSFEIFDSRRSDLYGRRVLSTPVLLGAILPPENYGIVDVRGLEVALSYKNRIGDLTYEIGGNFSHITDEIVQVDENINIRPYQSRIGRSSSAIFGYRTDGLIRTRDQLDALIASGYRFNNQLPFLGTILYEDLRGPLAADPDGTNPDGKITGDDQEYIAKYGNAPILYGVNLSLAYRGFGLSAQIQGLEGHYRTLPFTATFFVPVISEGAWAWWKDAFHPTKNPDGKLPRAIFTFENGGQSRNNSSEFWIRKAGFARVKNLSLSYSLPGSLLDRIGLTRATLYINSTNPFFIYRNIKVIDPELRGTGIPLTKTYTFGINLTL